jgi:surface polysaccharide O-acyltransferase-like enzyme
MTQQKINYYSEINYLRGLAILSVISIHISDYFTEMTNINLLTKIYMVIDALSQAAVPAFIFVSGFVLYNSYNANSKIVPFYVKKLKYILPPYIIFSAFYIIFDSKMNNTPINFNLLDILNKYLTGGAYYHLWFFVLIISLYILFPFVLSIFNYFKNKNKVTSFLAITFLVGVIGNSIFGEDYFFRNSTAFIGYLFYFVFGIFMKSNYEPNKLKSFLRRHFLWIAPLLLTGTILIIKNFLNESFSYDLLSFDSNYELIWTIFENAILTLYYTIFITIMLYISIVLSKSEKMSIINTIGSYSFAIYLIHPVFLDSITLELSEINFDQNNLLFYPLMFIVVLITSIFIVKVVDQMPYSKYIIGKIGILNKKEHSN